MSYIQGLVFGFCLVSGSIAGAITGTTSLPLAAIGVLIGVLCITWGRERIREYNRSDRY